MNNFFINLEKQDPEIFYLIKKEKKRQKSNLELIASENFTSKAVLECLGSVLTNKYAEGLPKKRYYGGCENIDEIEILCQKRALQAYKLDKTKWGVNVQPYSGSPANFAVYTALLNPHDRIMGLDLPSGGHLTHGYYTFLKKAKRKKSISATSKYFESLPYKVNKNTGLIDMDELEKTANLFKPSLIIMGASAYPRDFDYERFRKISNENGCLLLMDMAHISGLVATGEAKNPFDYCDIVTTTTHKTLRGPRSGMIFYKKEFEDRINMAVFPGLQGGPHVHQIAGVAVQLKEVQTEEFHKYIKQVKLNCKALGNILIKEGYKLCTGGSDNHLQLWDLRPTGISGSKMEITCDLASITLNKNAVFGDRSALSPGGVRIGTPALTTRGFIEKDFEQVAYFLIEALKIAQECQEMSKSKKLIDFIPVLKQNKKLEILKNKVELFANKFATPV